MFPLPTRKISRFMNKYSNKLVGETSPYLLQHAHNPVEWYPWGEEALGRARAEDKPILVSIGYAACHWCHVMERESFENEATAEYMNRHFINIKIDREERPDLDHIYMDAVQAMTGSGGWPLNVFLTPDARPFYGGTYFPPARAFNRASWLEVLQGVVAAFTEKREEVNKQADGLTRHLVAANFFGAGDRGDQADIFSADRLRDLFANVMKNADREWGGFGRAPKFPQSFTIQFLLRYHHLNTGTEALQQARLSLDRMIDGGIYDQLGGGFARYSTDTEWLAPHFEKMLYDNALLVSVLSEAFQLTGSDRYLEVIGETIAFVKRELMHPDGGFYSALDADSEGEEGKYYTWSKKEVDELLGKDAELFCRFYDITEKGNWEGKNILRRNVTPGEFASRHHVDAVELKSILERGKKNLFGARNRRIRPLLDDKVILGWNALMNTACSRAYMATGKEEFKELSLRNMNFLLRAFGGKDRGDLHHTWKNDEARYPAFLDDYAFLIEALLTLQEATADRGWLDIAGELADFVIQHFGEEDSVFFYYTRAGQKDVIVRKREVYDGALPSGNSVMAYSLHRLAIIFGKPEWAERSRVMISILGNAISGHPVSFGIWACLLQEITGGTSEIAIVGKNYEVLMREMHRLYLPHRVLMSAAKEVETFPLLAQKGAPEKALIFLCKEYVCQQPVDSIERFMLLIDRTENPN